MTIVEVKAGRLDRVPKRKGTYNIVWYWYCTLCWNWNSIRTVRTTNYKSPHHITSCYHCNQFVYDSESWTDCFMPWMADRLAMVSNSPSAVDNAALSPPAATRHVTP